MQELTLDFRSFSALTFKAKRIISGAFDAIHKFMRSGDPFAGGGADPKVLLENSRFPGVGSRVTSQGGLATVESETERRRRDYRFRYEALYLSRRSECSVKCSVLQCIHKWAKRNVDIPLLRRAPTYLCIAHIRPPLINKSPREPGPAEPSRQIF